jgi:hypothetical protein
MNNDKTNPLLLSTNSLIRSDTQVDRLYLTYLLVMADDKALRKSVMSE